MLASSLCSVHKSCQNSNWLKEILCYRAPSDLLYAGYEELKTDHLIVDKSFEGYR